MSADELDAKQGRRLLDVLNYSRKAVAFTSGIELADFEKDEMRQLSLERCFEVIGEASGHLTAETASLIGELPLQEMRGIRNLISHDYHRIKPEIILKTAQQDLPLLIQQIEPHEKQLYFAAKLEFPPSP
jgi:uncharacterized protein with HEPN domain